MTTNDNVHHINNCLIQHKVALMRSINTGIKEFREYTKEITLMLGYEALRELPTIAIEITTPLEKTKQNLIVKDSIVLLPILRAGLGMVDGIRTLLPTAPVGHVGMYRDHDTHLPKEYYFKVPSLEGKLALILDPMLATGGSVSATIDKIKQYKPSKVKVLSIVSAPEGIQHVLQSHGDVDIYVAAIDRELDPNKYILPGLGDAGDRLYGTK